MHFSEKLKSNNPLLRLEGRIERFKHNNHALVPKHFAHVAPDLSEAEIALYYLKNCRPHTEFLNDINDTPFLEWWREFVAISVRPDDATGSTDKESLNRK